MTAIVLEPSFPYAGLEAALTALGWSRTGGPAYEPLVPGEPEVATFARPGAGTVTYSCNPVVWLRVLDLGGLTDGVAGAALLVALPYLDDDAVATLLRRDAVEHVLLGVLAAGVVGSPRHLGAVRALLHHRDATVARAAATVVSGLAAAT